MRGLACYSQFNVVDITGMSSCDNSSQLLNDEGYDEDDETGVLSDSQQTSNVTSDVVVTEINSSNNVAIKHAPS